MERAARNLVIRHQQDRDPVAFLRLHGMFGGLVYGIAMRRLGCPQDAEDASQEVWQRVFKGLPSFRADRRSFKPWVITVARNTTESYARSRKAFAEVGCDYLDAWWEEPLPVGLGFEDRDELRRLMEELPRAQQEVLVLAFRGGLTNVEIARVLDRSEDAVKQQRFRALAKLAERFSRF